MLDKPLHDQLKKDVKVPDSILKSEQPQWDHSLEEPQNNACELTISNAEALCQKTEQAKDQSRKVIDKIQSQARSLSGLDLYNAETALMTTLDKLDKNSLGLKSPVNAPFEQVEAQKPLFSEMQANVKMAKQSLNSSLSKLKELGFGGTGYDARIEGDTKLGLLKDALQTYEALDQSLEVADRLAVSNQVPWSLQKEVDLVQQAEEKRVRAEQERQAQAEKEHADKVFEKDVIGIALGLEREYGLVCKGFDTVYSQTSMNSVKSKPYRSVACESDGTSVLGMALDEGGALGALMTVYTVASPMIIFEGAAALFRCCHRERVPNPYYVSNEKREQNIRKQKDTLHSFSEHVKTVHQASPETTYDRLPQETTVLVKEIFDTLPQMQSLVEEGQSLSQIPLKPTTKAYKLIHQHLENYLYKQDRQKLNDTWQKCDGKLRRRYKQLAKELGESGDNKTNDTIED